MFGMGFGEIILVAIVAVIFLGPEKLPQTMIDIAKFFRAFKKTINEAKENLDREINISEIKQEALSYKKSIETGTEKLTKGLSLDDLDTIIDSAEDKKPSEESKTQATPSTSQNRDKQVHGAEIDFKSATRQSEETCAKDS